MKLASQKMLLFQICSLIVTFCLTFTSPFHQLCIYIHASFLESKISIVTSPTLTNVVIFYVYLPQLILSFDNVIVRVIAVNLVSIQN